MFTGDDAMFAHLFPCPTVKDELGEYITLALNEYHDQAARISELEAENEKQVARRRKIQGVLRSWHNHIARMGKILGCVGIMDEVEDAVKSLQSRISELEKWLEFYGIEVYTCEKGDVHTKFKPSTMRKFRQMQNDTEVESLQSRISELEAENTALKNSVLGVIDGRVRSLEARNKALTEALERDKKQKPLDFAVQQFTGFHEAIRGRNDVTDLASSMGLTKSEFKKIRKELYFMHHDELAELDEYFKKETR